MDNDTEHSLYPDDITIQIVYLKEHTDETWQWSNIAFEVYDDDSLGEKARTAYRKYQAWKEDETGQDPETSNILVLADISSDRITTVDALIKRNEIDLDIWEIRSQSLRKWDGYSKRIEQDLKFSTGHNKKGDPVNLKEGTVYSDGKLNLVELIYVRVDLVRKEPIFLEPYPQPVVIEGDMEIKFLSNDRDYSTDIPPHRQGKDTILVLPDPHFAFRRNAKKLDKVEPLFDRRALSIGVKIAKSLAGRVRAVVWTGDILDLPDFSTRFNQHPDYQFLTQMALNEAALWIKMFDNAVYPNGPPSWENREDRVLEGNHDIRFEHLLLQRLPQVLGLKPPHFDHLPSPFTIPGLLGLHEEGLGIPYVPAYPHGEHWIDDIRFIHGSAWGPDGQTVKTLSKDSRSHTVQGHNHRQEMATRTVWRSGESTQYVSFTPGTFARPDGVMPPKDKWQNWQLGFGVITLDHTGGSNHDFEHVSIHNDSAMFRGELFESSEAMVHLVRKTAHI